MVVPERLLSPPTCRVDDAFGPYRSVRSLHVPGPLRGGGEARDRGRVVDLGPVHPGPGRQGHGQGVGVDVAVPRVIEPRQDLGRNRRMIDR